MHTLHHFAFALLVAAFASPAHAGRLIAMDSGRALYDLDITTGAKTQFGTVSSNAGTVGEITRDPLTGTIYLSSTSLHNVYTLDLATGTATLIGPYLNATFMHGLEWDSSTGTLYGAAGSSFYSVDTATGAATLVGATGVGAFINLGYRADTNVMYATSGATDSFYTIDRTTGAMTLIGALVGPTNPHSLAWDPEHQVMWHVDTGTNALYTINLATGAATLVGSTGSGNLLGLMYLPDSSTGTPFCFGDGTGAACPCGNSGAAGNGCASSVSTVGANLAGSGIASVSADTFLLTGSLMPSSSALYFQGTAQTAGGAGSTFGDGLRCASGSVIRLKTKTNVSGTSSYPGVGETPISIKGAVVAGSVREYQVWYRNAAAFCSPSTFNLTNGVEVTWAP
jgi:hypothetical protein